jgi:protein-S-isoprenylcysteine O-methyltransferase Ste14
MSHQAKHERVAGKKGGIDRSHDASFLPKLGFFFLHFGSILLCGYMIWGSGIPALGEWLGETWSVIDLQRGQLLVAVACLYWGRHTITLFYLLVRKVEWGEVFGLSFFMLSFEVGLCVLAAGVLGVQALPMGPLDGVAVALVLFGSFLNTGSEVQRKWWKSHSRNKGRCYTGGLFKWSMHINYFGDTVLFTGWCMLTANGWVLILPMLMACSFVFFHIPGLDAYLAERYGDEFIEYSKKTKKFIPMVY